MSPRGRDGTGGEYARGVRGRVGEGGDTGTRGHGDTGTRGHGDTGTRGHGDTGTRGHGDTGTRGHGDAERARGEDRRVKRPANVTGDPLPKVVGTREGMRA